MYTASLTVLIDLEVISYLGVFYKRVSRGKWTALTMDRGPNIAFANVRAFSSQDCFLFSI